MVEHDKLSLIKTILLPNTIGLTSWQKAIGEVHARGRASAWDTKKNLRARL